MSAEKVSTREPAEIEDGSVPFEREDSEDSGLGMRGLRFSSLLIFCFWLECIIFRTSDDAVSFAKEYSSSAGCDGVGLNDGECARNTIIFRSSLALIICLIVQGALAIVVSTTFFDGWWLVKVGVVVLINLAFLYPDITFDNDAFTWVARIAAFIFICLQSVLFLDWAYKFNHNAVADAMNKGTLGAAGRTFDSTVGSDIAMLRSNGKLLVLVIFSVLSLAVLITTMSLLYTYFGTEGCTNNITIITISFVGCVIATIVQLTMSSEGSILTSSIVGLYVSYLTYTSVSLNPRAECNSSLANNSEGLYGVGPLWIGVILSFLSFTYAMYFTARSITKFLSEDLPLKNLIGVVLLGQNSGVTYSYTGTKLDFDAKLRSIVLWLTVVLVLLVFWLSMVFTNWGTIATDSEVITSVAAGDVAMYMNAVGAWITIALYFVALIFPKWADCMPKSVWDLKPKM